MDNQNSFLITGFGRSGTKFLSSVMNLSPTWNVQHEPRGSEDIERIQPTPSVMEAFSQHNYGEVNSYLRGDLWDVPAAKKGVIIRNPQDIILSCANRNSIARTVELVSEVFHYHKEFVTIASTDCGVYVIVFEMMTRNKEYLRQTMAQFGIEDVDLNKVDLSIKVNANKRIAYPTFDQLPKQIKDEFNSLEW